MVGNARRASDFLKALAHESRLMILCILAEGEKSVSELAGHSFAAAADGLATTGAAARRRAGIDAARRQDDLLQSRQRGSARGHRLDLRRVLPQSNASARALHDNFKDAVGLPASRECCMLRSPQRHGGSDTMATVEQTARFSSAKATPSRNTSPCSSPTGMVWSTGATGTGKTVTLQVLAEGFSRAGVPVFAADIKGDLSGISAPGEAKDAVRQRARRPWASITSPTSFSVMFWDLFGQQGHPIRATISEMGPLLLSRLLELNDVQEGVLNIAFRIADETGPAPARPEGPARRAARWSPNNAAELTTQVRQRRRPTTVGTIQRQLAGSRKSGRRQILRRAGARCCQRFHAHRP